MVNPSRKPDFKEIYRGFSLPLCKLDCGERCGPFHDYGVPVCCDINILVPSAFKEEWSYLQARTDLWLPWHSPAQGEGEDLDLDLQEGQVLLQCRGYQHCQRDFRTITCRAFPFYPYLTGSGEFAGMTYYQEFRQLCWVISNLSLVSQAYKEQFRNTFQALFEIYPQTRQEFREYSRYMREKSAQEGETLILLDFSGDVFQVDPRSESTTRCLYHALEAYGPFLITRDLTFPDEELDQGMGRRHDS